MTTSTNLMRQRRFLPLFLTQLLNALNDNLYKNAMVLFVVYQVYDSPEIETFISGIATAVFVLPFVLFSATSGQLADMRDKATIIRWIKFAEIIIMFIGAAGLMLAARGMQLETLAIPLMFVALFAMGMHSTFFGPIKYSILPQHLEKDEVLAGTGLVEAGTYVAILVGMILGGVLPIMASTIAVIVIAVIGFVICRWVPPAPAQTTEVKVDWNPIRASKSLITFSMSNPELRYSVLAISYFWTIAAILSVQFIPLAKNVLLADKQVAAVLLVAFSAGIAIGSVSINALLKGDISARYSARSVLALGGLLITFYLLCRMWNLTPAGELFTVGEFLVAADGAGADRQSAADRGGGRDVCGAIVRVPDNARGQERGIAVGRGQQLHLVDIHGGGRRRGGRARLSGHPVAGTAADQPDLVPVLSQPRAQTARDRGAARARKSLAFGLKG